MNYFEQKAKEVYTELYQPKDTTDYEQKRIIEINLKEVARDIRHQLVDELFQNRIGDSYSIDDLNRIIINFEPKFRET